MHQKNVLIFFHLAWMVVQVQAMYLDYTSTRRRAVPPRFGIAPRRRPLPTTAAPSTVAKHPAIDRKCKKELRKLTREMRKDRVEKLKKMFPDHIHTEVETMTMAEHRLNEQMNISRRNELAPQCNTTKMSPNIKVGVEKYVNTTARNIKACAHKQKTAPINVCSKEDASSFRCRAKSDAKNLGERYYPQYLVHTHCTECKECMYAAGRCEQSITNITVYYDHEGRTDKELDKWEERIIPLRTSCKCVVKDNTALVALLRQFCKNHDDPSDCFKPK